MNAQLEILLQLQDLRSQAHELTSLESSREVEVQEFNIDLDKAVEDLQEKIVELEDELTPQIRGRYDRVRGGRGRVVVPVIHGTCYGCFVSLPTAAASEMLGNKDVRSCDNCGRFLYVIG